MHTVTRMYSTDNYLHKPNSHSLFPLHTTVNDQLTIIDNREFNTCDIINNKLRVYSTNYPINTDNHTQVHND